MVMQCRKAVCSSAASIPSGEGWRGKRRKGSKELKPSKGRNQKTIAIH
jgi:hypothetical protein